MNRERISVDRHIPTRGILGACLLVVLVGCASPQFVAKGEDVADQGLAGAEWYVCRAATVGSVLRRYGTSDDRMAAWRQLCTEVSSELK